MTNRSRHYHEAAFEQMIADFEAAKIDHVLCTGDVTNLALRQEFEFARGLFERIGRGPRDVTVIPGNHDAYVAEGVGLFGEIFEPYHRTDEGWEWPSAEPGIARRGSAAEGQRGGEVDQDADAAWPIVRVRGDL